ncbi:MAG: hypothetical protein MUF81_08840 [Verrucomicrobia bacterium]|jgi:hypothetical protein|nr:hypothetical protein [Verrucomicrobiota bacterium]
MPLGTLGMLGDFDAMDPLDINLSSVSAFSLYAISAARKYVELVEAQISQAHTEMRSAALETYRNIADPDETDYDSYVGIVNRNFEQDYRPILRFTEIIYLYMVFETYTCRHVAEIQALRNDTPDILKRLKSKHECGFVEAAQIYFQNHVGWPLLDDDSWAALCEVAEVRNCIVHNAGVARDRNHSELIDNIESRKWRDQSVGIEIDRYQGKDVGQPIIVHQRFLEYFLYLLDKFFNALVDATHAGFRNEKIA